MIPSISSLGRLSAELQRSPLEISEAAERLGIDPSLIINDVRHYAEDDVRKVAEHFRTGDRSTANAQPEPRH